jgi:septum formation protein
VKLILASTSRYRRELLERLGLPFETVSPDVDEQRLDGEDAAALALRLARAKALAVADRFPDALIIGSDQAASCAGQILGKPGSRENAIRQLTRLAGNEAIFHTAVCLHDTARGHTALRSVPYNVRFRPLSSAEIERYVDREQPYDCAGSAKSEALGIALLEFMRGDDPTALVGLPLIALSQMLRECGLQVP